MIFLHPLLSVSDTVLELRWDRIFPLHLRYNMWKFGQTSEWISDFFSRFPFSHKVYDMTIKSDIRDCNVLFIQGFQLYSVLLAICIMFDLILWWQKKLKTNTEKKALKIKIISLQVSKFKKYPMIPLGWNCSSTRKWNKSLI